MNTKYDFRTAVELPIGGNCRYFFNKSTLISKCDSTSEKEDNIFTNATVVQFNNVKE